MRFFASSFAQAEDIFCHAAACAGVDTCFFPHQHVRGRGGRSIGIRTARLGGPDARKCVVTLSATHGPEGYAGSAVQAACLAAGMALPDDTALVFVHGVNAFGFEYDSATNEDNVDLNRNFVSHREHRLLTPADEDVQALLTPVEMSEDFLNSLQSRLTGLSEKYGYTAVANAVTGGQYQRADGIGFGGTTQAWSNLVLRQLMSESLQRAEEVIFIDFHVGLGDYGEPFIMSFDAPDSAAHARALEVWGSAVACGGEGFSAADRRPDYSGLLVNGLAEELPQSAEVMRIVAEFGTFDNFSMLGALVIDRWLRYEAPTPLSAGAGILKRKMINCYHPDDDSWRQGVLKDGVDIVQKAALL